MGTYRLQTLFHPNSVAIVGASTRPESLGGAVLKMIIEGGFEGEIYPVNPHYSEISGRKCFKSLKSFLPVPDLVIVTTPAVSVPSVIEDAIEAGAKVAIILTAGLGKGSGSLAQQTLQIARKAGLRLVGPNCLGVLAPGAKLNASFARRLPKAGSLALVTQSGAVAAGVVEWAVERDIGFSGIVSIGDAIDVDFGDCLDYFAEDPNTKAILLYIEAVTDARKFMSAARKASRVKPVIILKSGRHVEAASAASTHTGALAGIDAVYDAAFRRAGCLRVLDLDELFAAAETLATQPLFSGERLAILTNGGGLGVLSVDKLMDMGGKLAALSPETVNSLNKVLPVTWSKSNPVDIIGDATAERYGKALSALMEDTANDAILVLNCPVALSPPMEAAKIVIDIVSREPKRARGNRPVFSFWMGSDPALRRTFEAAGIASFESESHALQGFMHLVNYQRRKHELAESVEPDRIHIQPDQKRANAAIKAASNDAREWLNPVEVASLLESYGISTVPVLSASDAAGAIAAAAPILAKGKTCVVKINSKDITHKSDVDGVRLGLSSSQAVGEATQYILENARRLRPSAQIDGVTVQPMILRPKARELIVGVTIDPAFGPVLLVGHGGTAVELIDDKAIALLPVNLLQARNLISRTRISRLLKGYRNVPPVRIEAVEDILLRVSQLVEDMPQIIGIDFNPLLVDEEDAVAIDARVQITLPSAGQSTVTVRQRFAIRPYPRELESRIQLENGKGILLRPLKPEDEKRLLEMLTHVSQEDMRFRFFNITKTLDRGIIARLTQLDYAREMALVAMDEENHSMLGVVRLHGDANGEMAEYAILVRSDFQGRGLGSKLMLRMIEVARKLGYCHLTGSVLADNHKMLGFCKAFGFTVDDQSDGELKMTRLKLIKE